MSDSDSSPETHSETPRKVDPLAMMALGVVFAIVIVGGLAIFGPMMVPTDAQPTDTPEPATATIQIVDDGETVVLHAKGDFGYPRTIFVYNDDTIVNTYEVTPSGEDQQFAVENVSDGDELSIYISADTPTGEQFVMSHTVGDTTE